MFIKLINKDMQIEPTIAVVNISLTLSSFFSPMDIARAVAPPTPKVRAMALKKL